MELIYVASIYHLPKYFLNHILNHYTIQGVDKFVFAVNCKNAWNELYNASNNYNIELHKETKSWWVNNDSDFKNKIRKTLNNTDWIIPADLDEFHFHQDFKSLKNLANNIKDYDGIYSTLVDKITIDGTIPSELLPNVPLSIQFPKTSFIGKNIMTHSSNKILMCRPHIPIYGGHHYISNNYKIFSPNGTTFHYKWFGNVLERQKERMNEHLKQKSGWHIETQKLLNYLEETNGRLNI